MKQDVMYVHVKEKITPTVLQDTYAFNKAKKYHWLQRLCLAVLKRLGCYAVTKTVTHDRVRVDKNVLVDHIFRQRTDMSEYMSKGGYVLIGAEDFAELMKTMCVDSPIQFDLHRPYIAGMRIIVLPWMRGTIVVPKGYLE